MNYSPPSALLLCLHTRYNLFAHSSCTSLFILLFIKSTVYCIAHFILLHILLLIFPSYFYFICTYIYIYSLVLCFIFLHCPLSGPVLTYISLLIISCIIEYVTNKITLNLFGEFVVFLEDVPEPALVGPGAHRVRSRARSVPWGLFITLFCMKGLLHLL